MDNKQKLQDKAIELKGKKYILVSDRVVYFNDTFPNGCIQTLLLSAPTDDVVFMRAMVTPDMTNPTRFFTGYSQAKWGEGFVNKTSAVENCETSAVGRALGMMGIGVIDSIASLDEINKAQTSDEYQPKLERAIRKLEQDSETMPLDELIERVNKGLEIVKGDKSLEKRLQNLLDQSIVYGEQD